MAQKSSTNVNTSSNPKRADRMGDRSIRVTTAPVRLGRDPAGQNRGGTGNKGAYGR